MELGSSFAVKWCFANQPTIIAGPGFPMMKSRVRGGIFLSFWTGLGVYFALFPPPLCLFDDHGENDIERIELPEFTDEVWHGCGLCSQPRARRQERSTGMRAACAIRRTRKKGALTHSEARILRTRLQRSAPLRDQQAEDSPRTASSNANELRWNDRYDAAFADASALPMHSAALAGLGRPQKEHTQSHRRALFERDV